MDTRGQDLGKKEKTTIFLDIFSFQF